MHRSQMSLKGVAAALVLWLVYSPGCFSAQESVNEFATKLREIIASGDVAQFRALTCYPAYCIDDDDVKFVIGTDTSEAWIRKFLRNPAVRIRVFGPYTYSDELENGSYVVMFYDPEMVFFETDGNLMASQREELWWKGYVETVITRVGSGWGFHRTPFYNGTEPPWMKDF